MNTGLPAYACASFAQGKPKCKGWCGDSDKCVASSFMEEAREVIKQRYIGQGSCAKADASNPYRPESNAAKWWQQGKAETSLKGQK